MASVNCTLALKDNSAVNGHLEVSKDSAGKQSWRTYDASGGLTLGATSGYWEWDAPTNALWLMKTKEDEYAISMIDVPSDFLLSVSCGTSIQGFGSDTDGKQLQYKLWFGCV